MYWGGAGEDDEEGEEGGTSGVCTGQEREDDEEGEEGGTSGVCTGQEQGKMMRRGKKEGHQGYVLGRSRGR